MSSRYGLSIRAAEGSDVDGLLSLMADAGVEIARERLSSRLAAVLTQPGVVLIAEEWGPPSGLIVAHWHSALTAEQMFGSITTLLVDPARRRSGVARLLLKAASQAARAAGCGELALTASPLDDDLRAFALATGFAQAGHTLTRLLRKRS